MQSTYDKSAIGNLISDTPEWLDLVAHVQDIEKVHLKDLLQDAARTEELSMESDGVYADFSRQRVTADTVKVCCQAHTSNLSCSLSDKVVHTM
jgi:hypothetical protein